MALTLNKLTQLINDGIIDLGVGSQGPPGADGADGVDGVDGVDGAKGDQGEKGDTGEKGDKGITGTFTGVNLLDNCDFSAPVNQRGVTGTISAAGYFYDRWRLVDGSVTIASGYLQLASGAKIEQRVIGHKLAGREVTVSVRLSGAATVYIGAGTFPTAVGTVNVDITSIGTATLGYHADYMYLQLSASDVRQITMVKMEVGGISSLETDPPVDYDSELFKCQYFLQALGSYPIFYGYTYDSTTAYFSMQLARKMRVKPTLSSTSISLLIDSLFSGTAGELSMSFTGALSFTYSIPGMGTYKTVNGYFNSAAFFANSEL